MKSSPHKRREPPAGGSQRETGQQASHRNAARAELQNLFEPAPRWCVTITKASTGSDVVFSTYTSKPEAEATCTRLQSFGLDARVQLIREHVAPGTTMREGGR